MNELDVAFAAKDAEAVKVHPEATVFIFIVENMDTPADAGTVVFVALAPHAEIVNIMLPVKLESLSVTTTAGDIVVAVTVSVG